MDGHEEITPQRATIDDSSAVVLHARWIVFLMLIASALVAIGVFVEDDARLNRALQDAEVVTGLMSHWHAETRDKDRAVSVTYIIAGPGRGASETRDKFQLRLVRNGESGKKDSIQCWIGLDRDQRFIVHTDEIMLRVVVVPNSAGERTGKIEARWMNRTGSPNSSSWLVKRTPYDLKEFSRLWNLLVSNRKSARIHYSNLEEQLKKALLLPAVSDTSIRTGDYETLWEGVRISIFHPELLEYRVDEVTPISNRSGSGSKHIHIAPLGGFVTKQPHDAHPNLTAAGRLSITSWDNHVRGWKNAKFDTAATGGCRRDKNGQLSTVNILFPVKLWEEQFDWTRAWIDRAIEQGHLSKDLRPKISNYLQAPFARAFSDLRREAEGLESLELTALHGWLQGRVDREGKNIEVAGIGMPRHLLRSLGLFFILVVQGYAARNLSEAASRMKSSRDGDPGAFAAWIVLYGGRLSLCAALGIVAVPTVAAATVTWILHEGGFWSPYFLASGAVLILSAMLLVYSVRSVVRLRTAAQHHRTSSASFQAEENA